MRPLLRSFAQSRPRIADDKQIFSVPILMGSTISIRSIHQGQTLCVIQMLLADTLLHLKLLMEKFWHHAMVHQGLPS